MSKNRLFKDKATPRGAFPHIKRAGDFLYISGTSSRLPDNSVAGVEVLDDMGTVRLDIEEQTRAVIEKIKEYLAAEGAELPALAVINSLIVIMNDFAG